MRTYYMKTSDMPEDLYRRTLSLIQGYERMRKDYDNAIWDSPEPPDGQPRGSNSGDPTSREALKRAELSRSLHAIEQARYLLPEEYRDGIWEHIVYGKSYPGSADRSTWWRYKRKFIREVAVNMYWL